MKKWKRDIEINAPIDHVWRLFDGSVEDRQKVMPNLIELETVTETENRIDSIYKQAFKVGSRFQTFEVKILEYSNQPKEKHLEESFVHSGLFEITTSYTLKEIDENKTHFTYATRTRPLKWYLRLFMLLQLSSGRMTTSFVNNVKKIAETKVEPEPEIESE
ncbi:SRPBCC family protein [Ornithinibacillus sp. 4-3]|uniref:SRPBCC family protein n=1 Tax=Ornithinibacillus sp. 4-3 TaxID=3231488 RepID=A0AB39HSS5_9BACI